MAMWTISMIIFGRAFFPKLFISFNFNPVLYANERLLWAIAMTWIIISCHYSRNGGLKKFLSLAIWMPIEKLGLSLYLSHDGNQVLYTQSRMQPIDFDVLSLVSFCIYVLKLF
jgi:hypothetical protein